MFCFRHLHLFAAILLHSAAYAICEDTSQTRFTGFESSYKLTVLTGRNDFGPWHDGSIGFHATLKNTPVQFNAHYQYRLYPETNTRDLQFAVDLWPKLANFFYADVNAGWSPAVKADELYPDWFILAEMYYTEIRYTELSAGVKTSFYPSSTPVLLTASYHFITESESIIGRIFCSPYHSGADFSASVQYRHTFTEYKIMTGCGLGGGTTSADLSSSSTVHNLLSLHAKVETKITFRHNWQLHFVPVYFYEEYAKDRFWNKFEFELKVENSWK